MRRIKKLCNRLLKRHIFLGLQPKSKEAELPSASDIIILPQKPTKVTVAQVPAKVFTAMAMEKVIIASKVSDLPEIQRTAVY